jgi:hypothetical protein
MTMQPCSKHDWITITWRNDDGTAHAHELICRHCAEGVFVTSVGEVTSKRRMIPSVLVA